MPELPEVENVKNGLKDLVLNRKIEAVTVLWDNIIKDPADGTFQSTISGQRIESIERRGKFLLFILDTHVLISHLRMEGKFRVEEASKPLTKHTHVIFRLDTGEELRYLDVRKFGRMSLVEKDNLLSHPSLSTLGPEPVAEALSVQWLSQFLNTRKRSVKSCLLDQKMVAGIGNIYADEILFASKIHPERAGESLSPAEIKALHGSIIDIMQKAVRAGGTTIRTYSNAHGKGGNYQQNLTVYGKTGKLCVNCQTPISKIKVAQRGTHYCPTCQI
ncbi:MAG: DNA-formamidopyrimidine glycosylase [Alkalibacterium sp.]|nr:DNA-formamidopyrimidine glycosylase [Alkalibacterium sp.]